MEQHTIGRRGILRAAGGLGIAALGVAAGRGTASAAIAASPRFDLTAPSYDLFRGRQLHDDTVQQGFAFDSVNKRLFVAQRRNGSGETSGDLCITELDFAGNRVSAMHLTGFGHGVAFGVEPRGRDSWLWTEVDANTNGYGTRLGRFKFVRGGSLSHTSSAIQKYRPVASGVEFTCSIDQVHGIMVVRHQKNGAKYIAAYRMSQASAGNFSSPVAYFKQPSIPGTAQGYTSYGQYLYHLTGNAYSASNPRPGNTRITCVDLNSGAVKQGPVLTKAGESLSYREPEGLAVYRTDSGQARLFIGFASGTAGDRRSNIFYKKALI
ncbi:teichoic acid biosynthesis protein C [Streptomyces sp. NPDC049099]|uniref:phage baseplate protein n=1 Tax=Streptomyces sp. NPDC049099 TaxID=3155768 RepID=UPI00344AB083